MSKDGRKNLIRIVESVAVALVVLDAAVFFAVIQPLRNMTQEAFARFDDERLQVRNAEARVKRLEWYQASVPSSEKELDDFMGKQVQPKRKSFTRLARLLRDIAEHSGVELSNFTFKPDTARDEPLDRMNISVSVAGSFPNLMDFAHGLETTTSDFIVIQDFEFAATEGSNVGLKLVADLYLTP